MKKWLVFVLLIVTVAGTFIPCCDKDDCCADQLATTSNSKRHQTEGTCSPFFACTTCSGFVDLSKPIQIVKPAVDILVHRQRIIKFNLATYASSFWQPPRFC